MCLGKGRIAIHFESKDTVWPCDHFEMFTVAATVVPFSTVLTLAQGDVLLAHRN